MNYYKRHLGDIAKSLSNLSQGQMGAYDLLLDWIYANEKPLPARKSELYIIGRCQTKAERANVDRVLEYFDHTEEGYTQKRALEEIESYRRRCVINKETGKLSGGRPKVSLNKTKSDSETESDSLSKTGSQNNPSHNPESNILTESILERTRDARPHATFEGSFEGQDGLGASAPNPVAPLAIALNRAGHRCTSMNPALLEYHEAGGTPEHLLEVAAHPDCSGKPATYVANFARRELTERAKTITHGATHADHRPTHRVGLADRHPRPAGRFDDDAGPIAAHA